MYKFSSLILLVFLLQGCSSLGEGIQLGSKSRNMIKPTGHITHVNLTNEVNALSGYAGSSRGLNFYANNIMQRLVSNMRHVKLDTPIAVTSFVDLNSSFNNSDQFGRQLSESMVNELHKFGLLVLDYKTTDFIRVANQGDFILSKDFLELDGDLPIEYVLAGTFSQQGSDLIVNARLIGLKSKVVVATASEVIPGATVNLINGYAGNDGLPMQEN